MLQTELEKEKESLRDALGKAQSSEEKQQENNELRTQLKQLQVKICVRGTPKDGDGFTLALSSLGY